MNNVIKNRVKLVAFDLDGTITQHKTKLSDKNRRVLDSLARSYKLLIVGAGSCQRIHDQLESYPIDIIGNYGMESSVYDRDAHKLHITEKRTAPIDKPSVLKRIEYLREKTGYLEYVGETVEFHESGMLTFPLLGTGAALPDKILFDPDRVKRRKIYPLVAKTFDDYNAFVGGSSSFDMSPKPFCKLNALDRYCSLHNLGHDEVAYAGDDYGMGGNDEDVYKSDIAFICVDSYLNLGRCVSKLL